MLVRGRAPRFSGAVIPVAVSPLVAAVPTSFPTAPPPPNPRLATFGVGFIVKRFVWVLLIAALADEPVTSVAAVETLLNVVVDLLEGNPLPPPSILTLPGLLHGVWGE